MHDDVLIQEGIDNKAVSDHQGNAKETKSNESLSNGVLEHQASSNASNSELLSHASQNGSLESASEHNNQTKPTVELPKHTTTELHNETKTNVTKEDHVGSDEESMHDILNMGVTTNATDTVKSMGSQRRLLTESETESSKEGDTGGAATVKNNQDLAEEADSSFDLFRDGEDGLTDEYAYDYDDYVDESAWGDEDFAEAQHPKPEDFVNIDSHILCTPVIADIDKDGVDEMSVAASYFFDHEYYDNPAHSAELGGIDVTKYVAGAIVVFNLDTKQVKWSTQLDLSTDSGTFRAHIYSSPSVVDLDGDGYLDILVGTSFGFFYVLDNHGFT